MSSPNGHEADRQRQAHLVALVQAADPEDIESGRSIVQPNDVPGLAALYEGLSWTQRLALVDLIQDQSHPSMEPVMRDILRAPGQGDWVDLPKAVALGYLDEDLDQFMAYYNDRDLLHDTVRRFLRSHGQAIEGEADPPTRVPNARGATTVGEAAANGQRVVLRRLLRDGASPDVMVDGEPALLRALMNHHPTCAIELLYAGADPNSTRNTANQSALWWAAGNGHADVVGLLLDKEAAVDAPDRWGGTPLMQAASSGHTGCVRRLLRAGADPTATYHDGRTVISLA
ncbi:MAG: ankyrin repeat domain-containing protein, partial [Myxococcota bacterium]